MIKLACGARRSRLANQNPPTAKTTTPAATPSKIGVNRSLALSNTACAGALLSPAASTTLAATGLVGTSFVVTGLVGAAWAAGVCVTGSVMAGGLLFATGTTAAIDAPEAEHIRRLNSLP